MNIDITSFIEQMPGFVFCKDKESNYLACSKRCAKLFFSKQHSRDCVGLNTADIVGKAAAFAETWIEQDIDIFDSKKGLMFLNVNSWADDNCRVFITEKSTNEQGSYILANNYEVTDPLFVHTYRLLAYSPYITDAKQYCLSTNNSNKAITLSKREESCLFFLLRGKSYKAIAKLLCISPRTVDDIVYQLRVKFNCNNKNELIDTAIDCGYLNSIPTDFLLNLNPTSTLLAVLED